MAAEDRTSDKGGGEHREGSNVVPFPGDWIGPREELIPVATSGPPRATQPTRPDVEGEEPLAPDTFWSEYSEALHDVLRAPGDARQDLEQSPVPAVPKGAAPHSLRARLHVPPSLGGATLAAAAVMAVVAMVLPALVASPPERRPVADRGAQTVTIASVTGRSVGNEPAVREAPRPVSTPARSHRGHVRRSRTITTGMFVSDHVIASSIGGGQSSSFAGGGQGGGTAGGGSGQSSPPPGPVGAGAPFGPGIAVNGG